MMRIQALVLLATLAGCAAQAAGPGASVDVNALVRSHPLYSALSEYNRQIAALRSTLHVPEFAQKTAAFEHASAAVSGTLGQTASRARDIAAMPTPDVTNLRSNTNVNAPSEDRVRSDMQQAYNTQAAQLRSGAQQDMDRYRTQLLAQQSAAFNNYVRAVHARVQQAYISRQQQLYEKESTLGLDLARADASKRLAIRAKLQTLTLSSDRRRRLVTQMNALQAHEDAILAKQRRRDQATLSAFLPPLQARANADIAHMQTDLQQRTAANLAARERVLAAQSGNSKPLDLGATAQPAAAATDMNAQLDALLRAQPADPSAFLRARDELTQQYASVRSADDTATHSTWAQIALLETQRAQLYSDIVSQIMTDAKSVAGARGLGDVYARTNAPPGSTDITQYVRADFAALAR